jgi:hypothetical protein
MNCNTGEETKRMDVSVGEGALVGVGRRSCTEATDSVPRLVDSPRTRLCRSGQRAQVTIVFVRTRLMRREECREGFSSR